MKPIIKNYPKANANGTKLYMTKKGNFFYADNMRNALAKEKAFYSN